MSFPKHSPSSLFFFHSFTFTQNSFRTWKSNVQTQINIHRLMKRVKYGYVLITYEEWKKDTKEILLQRKRKIAPVFNRIVHRLLVLTFDPWKKWSMKMKKIKIMMRKSFSNKTMYYYEMWADYVLDIQNKRKEEKDHMFHSASMIQKYFRGYICRHISSFGSGKLLHEKKTMYERRKRIQKHERDRKKQYVLNQKRIDMEIVRSQEEERYVRHFMNCQIHQMMLARKTKDGQKRIKMSVLALMKRVLERNDGRVLSKERAKEMVLHHERYDLKRRSVLIALKTYRSGKDLHMPVPTVLPKKEEAKGLKGAKSEAKSGAKEGGKGSVEGSVGEVDTLNAVDVATFVHSGTAPLVECSKCYRGFGLERELNSHVCLKYDEIDRLALLTQLNNNNNEVSHHHNFLFNSPLLFLYRLR